MAVKTAKEMTSSSETWRATSPAEGPPETPAGQQPPATRVEAGCAGDPLREFLPELPIKSVGAPVSMTSPATAGAPDLERTAQARPRPKTTGWSSW